MSAGSSTGWTEIPGEDLGLWSQRLHEEPGACLEQYPFWNERYRAPLVSLRYLYYGPAGAPSAYMCLFTIGIPGLRVGLVANGPASLGPGNHLSPEMVRTFVAWARRQGYAFVRFTHPDTRVLDSMSEFAPMEEADPFKSYLAPSSELVVTLSNDEARIPGGFNSTARRLIRQATRADYRLEVSDTPEALAALWPFFLEHAQRKGLQYRSLERYLTLMRLAQPIQCARLYAAYLGARPVNAILILRDRKMAYYQMGASDPGAFEGRPSPSCLMHFTAMRDAYAAGAKTYNLGIRAGPVYAFKQRFRPTEIVYPKPRVMILNRPLYRLWDLVVCRYSSTFVSVLNGLQWRKRRPASDADAP